MAYFQRFQVDHHLLNNSWHCVLEKKKVGVREKGHRSIWLYYNLTNIFGEFLMYENKKFELFQSRNLQPWPLNLKITYSGES